MKQGDATHILLTNLTGGNSEEHQANRYPSGHHESLPIGSLKSYNVRTVPSLRAPSFAARRQPASTHTNRARSQSAHSHVGTGSLKPSSGCSISYRSCFGYRVFLRRVHPFGIVFSNAGFIALGPVVIHPSRSAREQRGFFCSCRSMFVSRMRNVFASESSQ